MKRWQAQRDGIAIKDLSLTQRLLAGACAGLSYWIGTYPLDVVKVLFLSTA